MPAGKPRRSLKEILQGIKNEPQPESFKDTLKELAESSSLHGIPKIVSSRQVAVKVLWCLLFLATVSVLAYQLVNLFQTYYSYPIQTSVSLQFSSNPFPAISICNMNPVRKSKLSQSEVLSDLINDVPGESNRRKRREARFKGSAAPPNHEPKSNLESDDSNNHIVSGITELERLHYMEKFNNEPKPEMQNILSELENSRQKQDDKNLADVVSETEGKEFIRPTSALNEDEERLMNYGPVNVPLRRYEREASGSSDSGSSSSGSSGSGSSSSGSSGSGSSSSDSSSYYNYYSSSYYYYDYNYYSGGYMNDGLDYWDSYYKKGKKKDIWEQRVEDVKSGFRNTTLSVRGEIGHQKEDLFLSATFAGQSQTDMPLRNFSSNDYGNCYTLSHRKYIAWRSGPSYGFKITLNLEVDEYIENFTTGYGARVVFHEPYTQPLPSKDGITLSPGTETNIGLKTVKISRLGSPHGNCETGKDFAKKYKMKYSLTACNEFCRMQAIVDKCACLHPDTPDEISFNTSYVPVCNSFSDSEHQKCVFELNLELNDGSFECDCLQPCSEFVYTKTMSSTYWPTFDYLNILLDDVCGEKNTTAQWNATCSSLEYLSYEDQNKYRNNFVRVLIYFEDLNYEQIKEEPLYEGVRFLSDIGGAMGLFMGASVLSFVEVAQLILEIILYAKHRYTHKTHKTRVSATNFNN